VDIDNFKQSSARQVAKLTDDII